MRTLTVRVAGLSHIGERETWDACSGENPVGHLVNQVSVHVLAYIASWGPICSGITKMDTTWVSGDQPDAWVLRVDLHAARLHPDLEHGSPVRETFLTAVASLVELSLQMRWAGYLKSLDAGRTDP